MGEGCVVGEGLVELGESFGWSLKPSPPALLPARRGADASIKNAEGKTAAEVAQLNEQAELVALLEGK